MVSLKCKEYICILYSGILFLSGVFLIGFSAVLSYKLFQHFKFLPSDALGPVVFVLCLGFLHLLLTWLGIKGPTKEHDFHIIMFVIFTCMLFFMEMGAGIWALTFKFNLRNAIEPILKDSLSQYIKNDYDKKDWMILEKKLHCCGMYGFSDYKEKGVFPLSCCSNESASNVTCSRIYELGCMEPFVGSIGSIMLQTALAAFLTGLYQVLGVVIFFFFYKHLRKERKNRTTLRRQSRIYSSTNQQHQQTQPSVPTISTNS